MATTSCTIATKGLKLKRSQASFACLVGTVVFCHLANGSISSARVEREQTKQIMTSGPELPAILRVDLRTTVTKHLGVACWDKRRRRAPDLCWLEEGRIREFVGLTDSM